MQVQEVWDAFMVLARLGSQCVGADPSLKTHKIKLCCCCHAIWGLLECPKPGLPSAPTVCAYVQVQEVWNAFAVLARLGSQRNGALRCLTP